MSDFIYSSVSKPKGELTKCIQGIYHDDVPEIYEYHGSWGSLAVSRNLYNGFQPLETDTHIIVVIGGPVLCYKSNIFLTGNNPTTGTKEIYGRWQTGSIQWDEDLSGPFVVLIVEKISQKIYCIVDLMAFIPVYKFAKDGIIMLGTHVDTLAESSKQLDEQDEASWVDFVLHNVVTYPYTFYKNIYQCHPAAVHYFERSGQELKEKEAKIYWWPEENNLYSNINHAAQAFREGIQDYIHRITEGMDEVAQFLSAGEDSRAISGMLPRKIKRNAFIFLDSMNREGRISRKVAKVYGANFHAEYRDKTHYLDILSEASDLIGSGYQHFHAHSLGFHKACSLDHYSAVFGGYFSDILFKAKYSRKFRGQNKLPFIPQFVISGETRSKPVENQLFSRDILGEINRRRREFLGLITAMRKKTAHEWFMIWPATKRPSMANLYCNRRLFRTYEPFMCKQVVKISASVPTSWKLNRRLFHKAFRPFMKPSRWIYTGDGRLPWFKWWVNVPIQFSFWLSWSILDSSGLTNHQGPWGDWKSVMNNKRWQETISRYRVGFDSIRHFMKSESAEKTLDGNNLNLQQKVNFIQLLYLRSRCSALGRMNAFPPIDSFNVSYELPN